MIRSDGVEIQWCVFYGGPDPENAAGVGIADEEAYAREQQQWFIESGVASRSVTYGPWVVQPPETGP